MPELITRPDYICEDHPYHCYVIRCGSPTDPLRQYIQCVYCHVWEWLSEEDQCPTY